jgi:hypothetical protein
MRIPKMFRNRFPGRIRMFAGVILLAASFANARAAVSQPGVALPGSSKKVETWTQAGTPDPHTPFIIRSVLKATENAAPMEFEVALRMRKFSELQSRVARGERISPGEMASKYNPAEADYAEVSQWLSSQGFEITHQVKTHMAIFARGTVSQIAEAFQVTFARVTSEGSEYTSAVTAPQVPATLAPLLVGINGLQPFILLHTPPILRPNNLNGAAGGSGPVTYMPAQIATAYMVTGLYGSNITGT